MSKRSYAPRGVKLPHLREWRMARLMTQQKLSKATISDDLPAINPATISRIEQHATPASWGTIERLAAALKITPQQLVNESPDEQ